MKERKPLGLELLARTSPRETSGSSSSNRFDYQKSWALCRLLDLHAKSTNYVMLLDYHDDVVVIDREKSRDRISFYQIKTKKSGNWNLRALLARKKSEKKNGKPLNSFLGRLFSNYATFPDDTVLLSFVSNAPFNLAKVDMPDALSATRIRDSEMSSIAIAEINAGVSAESSRKCSFPYDKGPVLELRRSDLPIEGHDTFAKGRVADFVDTAFSDCSPSAIALYKSLDSEIRRRTNREETVDCVNSLLSRKAIDSNFVREELSKMRDDLVSKIDYVKELANQLRSEGVSPRVIKKITEQCRVIDTQLLDVTNEGLRCVLEKYRSVSRPIFDSSDAPLFKMAEEIVSANKFGDHHPQDYQFAIVLREFYVGPETASADSEPSEVDS